MLDSGGQAGQEPREIGSWFTGLWQEARQSIALNFKSTTCQWLVVAGARAQFKGTGTINGEGSYQFMLTAIDGNLLGGAQPDRFRIKIKDTGTDLIIYDNQVGTDDTGELSTGGTVVQGGSVVVHNK